MKLKLWERILLYPVASTAVAVWTTGVAAAPLIFSADADDTLATGLIGIVLGVFTAGPIEDIGLSDGRRARRRRIIAKRGLRLRSYNVTAKPIGNDVEITVRTKTVDGYDEQTKTFDAIEQSTDAYEFVRSLKDQAKLKRPSNTTDEAFALAKSIENDH